MRIIFPYLTDVFVVVNNKETFLKDWPIACICTRKSVSLVPRVKQKGKLKYCSCVRIKDTKY